MNNGEKKEIKWYSSISTKIISAIVIACMVSVTASLVYTMPKCRTILRGYVSSYMTSLASDKRDILELKEVGAEDLTAVYEDVLKSVQVEGVDGSYAYLVSADGTMLYHPTAEKIGSPVENEAVAGVVKKLQAGTVPPDAVVNYLYKGKIKYAGYALTDSHEILVVTADEDKIMGSINRIRTYSTMANMIIVTICGIVGAFMSLMITKPLGKLKGIIQNTGNFNFKHNPDSDAMCKRQDETGAMARAIRDMRGKLRSLVTNIDAASDQITVNVNALQEATNVVNSMCTDNSATTEELAAGMQETAATTETIHGNVSTIREGAVNIETLSVNGAKLSNDVMDRAVALKDTTDEASSRTKKMYESVKEKSDSAIEGSKAVDKINELTDTIMAISSQTSLLALNASIEAARAGEAGRGFAVVATEIGNLADQTSKAIADINSIVGEVNGAVDKMSECLEETTKFLESTVLGDYNEFSKVGVQYSEDATEFKSSMNGIHEAITNLSESITVIADALEGISATVSQSTVGVSDIAEKTTDMVGKSSENYALVNESLSCAKKLSEMVDQFILE